MTTGAETWRKDRISCVIIQGKNISSGRTLDGSEIEICLAKRLSIIARFDLPNMFVPVVLFCTTGTKYPRLYYFIKKQLSLAYSSEKSKSHKRL